MYGYVYILYNININIVMLKPECANGGGGRVVLSRRNTPSHRIHILQLFFYFKNLKDYCLSGLFCDVYTHHKQQIMFWLLFLETCQWGS